MGFMWAEPWDPVKTREYRTSPSESRWWEPEDRHCCLSRAGYCKSGTFCRDLPEKFYFRSPSNIWSITSFQQLYVLVFMLLVILLLVCTDLSTWNKPWWESTEVLYLMSVLKWSDNSGKVCLIRTYIRLSFNNLVWPRFLGVRPNTAPKYA